MSNNNNASISSSSSSSSATLQASSSSTAPNLFIPLATTSTLIARPFSLVFKDKALFWSVDPNAPQLFVGKLQKRFASASIEKIVPFIQSAFSQTSATVDLNSLQSQDIDSILEMFDSAYGLQKESLPDSLPTVHGPSNYYLPPFCNAIIGHGNAWSAEIQKKNLENSSLTVSQITLLDRICNEFAAANPTIDWQMIRFLPTPFWELPDCTDEHGHRKPGDYEIMMTDLNKAIVPLPGSDAVAYKKTAENAMRGIWNNVSREDSLKARLYRLYLFCKERGSLSELTGFLACNEGRCPDGQDDTLSMGETMFIMEQSQKKRTLFELIAKVIVDKKRDFITKYVDERITPGSEDNTGTKHRLRQQLNSYLGLGRVPVKPLYASYGRLNDVVFNPETVLKAFFATLSHNSLREWVHEGVLGGKIPLTSADESSESIQSLIRTDPKMGPVYMESLSPTDDDDDDYDAALSAEVAKYFPSEAEVKQMRDIDLGKAPKNMEKHELRDKFGEQKYAYLKPALIDFYLKKNGLLNKREEQLGIVQDRINSLKELSHSNGKKVNDSSNPMPAGVLWDQLSSSAYTQDNATVLAEGYPLITNNLIALNNDPIDAYALFSSVSPAQSSRGYDTYKEAVRRLGARSEIRDEKHYNAIKEDLKRNPHLLASHPEWQSHKPFVLAALSKNGKALQYASAKLRENKEVVLAAVKQNGLALEFASTDLKSDPEVVLVAIKQNGFAIFHVDANGPKNLQKDDQYVLEAVVSSPEVLLNVSKKLKNNYAFNLAAVTRNGRVLEYVSGKDTPNSADDWKNNDAIVEAAVTQYGKALKHAHPNQRKRETVVLKAVTQDGLALEFADESQKKSEKIAEAAVTQNGFAYKFISATLRQTNRKIAEIAFSKYGCALKEAPAFQDDDKMVFIACKQDGLAYEHASPRLRKDPAFALRVVKEHGQAYQFIDPSLRSNSEINVEALKTYPWALKDSPQKIKENFDIALKAVSTWGMTLQHVAPALAGNLAIVLPAVTNDGLALEFALNNLNDNDNIVIAALTQNGLAYRFASPRLRKNLANALIAVNQNPDALQFVDASLGNHPDIFMAAQVARRRIANERLLQNPS